MMVNKQMATLKCWLLFQQWTTSLTWVCCHIIKEIYLCHACWYVLHSCLFFLFWVCVCTIILYFILNRKNGSKGSCVSEANEQLQGVLLTNLRLITNIFNNLAHSNQNVIKSLGLNDTFTSPYVHPFNVPILFNRVQEKKSRDFDLLQYYMFNSGLTIPIYTTHLPPNLQSFITTSSLFLGLYLPWQTEHGPMCPIPNSNIMVELTPKVVMGIEHVMRFITTYCEWKCVNWLSSILIW